MNRRRFLATSALAASAFAAQAEKKWRVGVIGHTGRGGYGHGLDTMWLHVPETEIIAIADADAAGLAAARKKLKDAPGFADYRAMLREAKPELVAIGPRHVDQHREMLLAAIESGARGIYVEKPFVRTLADADEVIAAAEKTGARIAIAHRNRYHPVLPEITNLVEAGAIGRLLEIRARGKEDQRGGALDLWVLGSHLLNVAFVFSGPPRACSGTLLQGGRLVTKADVRDGDEGLGPLAGNELHARIDTESGVPIYFDSIAKAGVASAGFGVQLVGNEGFIHIRADGDPLAFLVSGSPFAPGKEPRAWTPISSGGPGVPEAIPKLREQVVNHVLVARDLIGSIEGRRAPLCSAEDGRAIVEVISGIFESHRLGGARVTLPLKTRDNPLARL
ncbi:MAG: Gfo/Idh/MocA family oxidoreductase [Chthoniobacteraceae bacterium]